MRRVDSEADLDDAITTARTEARNAFGSDNLIIEKLIERPRHVEIQIIADEHGNCLYLGERDCSVQRRNQKIVEEAPCPVMTPVLRERMGKAAVDAAKAAGYTNAGTVEFLLDDKGHFYFLEMNTRLQVEHPVTELITGHDLVSLQLQVAQGEHLPIVQDNVQYDGHAIEVRICAEDAYQDFAPQVGTIRHWQEPDGDGVRVDTGVQSGSTIPPFYDSMAAKLIVYGSTRAEALMRLNTALQSMTIFGVTTNTAFLQRIIEHETFAAGEATTAFLGESGLLDHSIEPPCLKTLAIAGALLIEHDARAVPASMRSWRSTGPAVYPVRLVWNDQVFELSVAARGQAYEVTHESDTFALELRDAVGAAVRLSIDGRTENAIALVTGAGIHTLIDGRTDQFQDVTYAPPEAAGAQSDGLIKAPMSGQIANVHIKEGDTVAKDDVLLIIEAMKMLNHIVAPIDGVVESVNVNEGDQVNANQVLLQLRAVEG